VLVKLFINAAFNKFSYKLFPHCSLSEKTYLFNYSYSISVRNSIISLNFILNKNEKVKYYIKIKIFKL